MGRRTLLELLHIAVGVAATSALAAWAVPSAARTIWPVTWVSMACVVGTGVKPLREERAVDRDISGGESGLCGLACAMTDQ